jgi:hypothetical protein
MLSDQIQIMSYNAYMRPCKEFKDAQLERSELIPNAILSTNPNVDVIVFNGVYDPEIHLNLVKQFELHEFKFHTKAVGSHVHVQKRRSKKSKMTFSNNGVFIISKHPIECNRTQQLGTPGPTGITYVSIRKNGLRFHLFATELCDWRNNSEARIAMSFSVKEFINDMHIPKYEPTMLAGYLGCDLLQDTTNLNEITEVLECTIPDIGKDSFRASHSSDNTMIGYTKKTPPFKDTWENIIVTFDKYRQARESELSCIRVKPEYPIKLYKSCCCTPIVHKTFRDISPHYPVMLTIEY